jgi:hypothetical protein
VALLLLALVPIPSLAGVAGWSRWRGISAVAGIQVIALFVLGRTLS